MKHLCKLHWCHGSPGLLLIPCTSSESLCHSSESLCHRSLGVTQLSHYAHLIPIPLISTLCPLFTIVLSFIVPMSVGLVLCCFGFRAACTVYSLLRVSSRIVLCNCYYRSHPVHCLRVSSCVFIRGLTSLFCLGYIPVFLYACLFWALSPCLSWHVVFLGGVLKPPITYSSNCL